MNARRILICLHDFARAGTERIAIGLARDWAMMGREVVILCGTQEGGLRDMVDAGVQVVTVEPPIGRSLFSRGRLGRAMGSRLADLQPDIIFLPGNFHLPLAKELRRAAPASVLVLKISNPPLPQKLPACLGRPLFRHFARPVDGFAALTSDFARQMERIAPGKPAPVLHDPVYLHGAAADTSSLNQVRSILWAGRLEPQKDIGLALCTMAALEYPAHLTILGDGALAAETDTMIARLGLAGRITRVGAVLAIDSWLAQAHVLLMTSRYEGQPAVVGEALAYGVPVVSTDCCSMLREVMTIPQAGRIVASREPAALAAALAEICAMPRPPRAMLAALVAPFEPQLCARAYLDWFDRMTDRRET